MKISSSQFRLWNRTSTNRPSNQFRSVNPSSVYSGIHDLSNRGGQWQTLDCLVEHKRPELELTFTKKHNELIAATELFSQTLKTLKHRGWYTHANLWNTGIYLNIAAHDLSVLVMQLHFERNAWTRRQIARHVVLTIYEVTEEMTQFIGQKNKAAPRNSRFVDTV